jgi:hypothetical protein
MGCIPHLLVANSGHDSIVVFMEGLSNRVHLEPCRDVTSAEEFAGIFLQAIFKYHGLPLEMVLDRDSRFIRQFWTDVC